MRLSHSRQTGGKSSHQETNWDLSQVKINCCVFLACWIQFDPDRLWDRAQDLAVTRGTVSWWLQATAVEVGGKAPFGDRKVDVGLAPYTPSELTPLRRAPVQQTSVNTHANPSSNLTDIK